MMRTSNPTLSTDVFKKESQLSYAQDESMTVSGTASKTGILLLLCIFSAGWIWNQISTGAITSQALQGWMMGGAIGGLVVAIATVVTIAIATPITIYHYCYYY